MKTSKKFNISISSSLAAALLVFSCSSFGDGQSPLVDDFSDDLKNNFGIPRQFMNDSLAGGATSTEQSFNKGIMTVKGEIVPPRGQPGWASSVIAFNDQGLPHDASAYQGIRMRVKVKEGSLSISANSVEVANFDFHAAPIALAADGKFHEVKVPFSSMKRAWSQQTPLSPETINSISIVAYSIQRSTFEFSVDELSFY